MIASVLALRWRRRLSGIALQPVEDVVVIALPVPQHSGQRLPLHPPRILIVETGVYVCVKLIGFTNAIGEDLLELRKGIRSRSRPAACAFAASHCPVPQY